MPAGLDDRGSFFRSSVAANQNADYLAAYLPESKRCGLRVIIYFNVHFYRMEFGAQHSDWIQVKEDGKLLDGVYEHDTSFCVNNPWREWCFRVLRDLAAYPIDGIFYDGPIFFPETCYCRYCQEKYARFYDGKLPSKKKRQGQAARQLLEF